LKNTKSRASDATFTVTAAPRLQLPFPAPSLSSSRAEAHSTRQKLDRPMSFKRPVRRACLASVSSAPSKIPYGGFSPVRLQTGFFRRHLRRLRRLIDDQLHQCLPAPHSPICVGAVGCTSIHSGPEALGFPANYVVPPESSLPMASSEPLCLSGQLINVFAARSLPWSARAALGSDQRVPNLSCTSVPPCRFPYPGGPGGERLFYLRPWQPSPDN
jgi:hypothetical protein